VKCAEPLRAKKAWRAWQIATPVGSRTKCSCPKTEQHQTPALATQRAVRWATRCAMTRDTRDTDAGSTVVDEPPLRLLSWDSGEL
jgi:hypothetical protein